MTRTPILNRLQQLCRDFAQQEATGRPLAEIQADRLSRTTRRQFLKIAAAGAAGALVRPLPAWAAPLPRIAIGGGGVAGLHAALMLHDAGIPSTVYEASSRIGGRMHSDTTSWRNGQVTERYGELIDSSHETILRLAKRFRIGLWDVLAAQPRRSTDTFYFSGQYYPLQKATTDFEPVNRVLKKDLREAGYPTPAWRKRRPGTATSRASTVPRTSRASWKAPRLKAPAPPGKSSTQSERSERWLSTRARSSPAVCWRDSSSTLGTS